MDIAAPRMGPGARPRMLMCYLCGREFGSKSLPIHIPQCQKKWMTEEEKKPKKERRPLPPPPPSDKAIATGGSQAIDEFNAEATAAFEQSLEQCPHCQRRFVPKAFKHHSVACTAAHPAKPAGTGLIANSLSNRLVPGLIAGSKHGFAKVPPPNLHKKIDLYRSSMKQKIMEAHAQQTAGNSSPGEQGQSSRGGAFCDECGAPYERPDSKFCSQCGNKRSSVGGRFIKKEKEELLSPRSRFSPKLEDAERQPETSVSAQKREAEKHPLYKAGRYKKRKEQDDDEDEPVEIVLKLKIPDE